MRGVLLSRAGAVAQQPAGSALWTPGGGGGVTIQPGMVVPTNYGSLVKDYDFTLGAMPTDWSKITDVSQEFAYKDGNGATELQPSQVAMVNGVGCELIAATTTDAGFNWRCGGIYTAGSYTPTHGRIVASIRMPCLSGGGNAQGLWGAFWAVNPGGNPEGEIDIVEMNLVAPTTVWGTPHQWHPTHWDGASAPSGTLSGNASAAFHDYGVTWEPGMLTWDADGVAYKQLTKAAALTAYGSWPFDTQTGTALIVDIDVVPGASNIFGAGINSTVTAALPVNNSGTNVGGTLQQMVVERVKVWQ